jgi:uncharacterized protein
MKKQFPCPTCKTPTSFQSTNPWRPFCSERCRLIDLGDWMEGNNKIASEPAEFFNPDSVDDDVWH